MDDPIFETLGPGVVGPGVNIGQAVSHCGDSDTEIEEGPYIAPPFRFSSPSPLSLYMRCKYAKQQQLERLRARYKYEPWSKTLDGIYAKYPLAFSGRIYVAPHSGLPLHTFLPLRLNLEFC
jgi:hypothetical protein